MTERKVLRVQWHDYNNGVYFITICTFQKNTYSVIYQREESIIRKKARLSDNVSKPYLSIIVMWNYGTML